MHHNVSPDTAVHRPEAHRHLGTPARRIGAARPSGRPRPASDRPRKDAR